jgi:hypothetical protein
MRRSNPYVNRVSIGSKTSLSCASWGGRSFLGTLSAALSPYERRTSSGPGILFPPTPLSYASIIRDMRAREKMWPVLFKSNLFVLSFQSCESVQANCQSRGAQSQNKPPPPSQAQESGVSSVPKGFFRRVGYSYWASGSGRSFCEAVC